MMWHGIAEFVIGAMIVIAYTAALPFLIVWWLLTDDDLLGAP